MYSKSDYITFFQQKATNARNMAAIAGFKGLRAEAGSYMERYYYYGRQVLKLRGMKRTQFYAWCDERNLPHNGPLKPLVYVAQPLPGFAARYNQTAEAPQQLRMF